PARGGEALKAAFAACAERGTEAHGVWSAAEVSTAVASTTGASATDRVTDAFMKVTAIAPSGRSGFASQTGVATSAVDPRALAERAAAKAALPGDARRLTPGEYPVVLEPAAVGELMQWLGAM